MVRLPGSFLEALAWGRGEIFDGDAHQFRQRTHAELGLQLTAGIGDGLVAHMQIGREMKRLKAGDGARGLAIVPSD